MNNLLFKILRQILVNQSIVLDGRAAHLQLQGHSARVVTVELIREIDDSSGENVAKKSKMLEYPLRPCLNKIDWKAGDIAEVKQGWDRAGFRFNVLGSAVFLGQWWVPIEDPKDDEPDEPTYHKEAALKRIE